MSQRTDAGAEPRPSLQDLRRRVDAGRAPRPFFTRISQAVARHAGRPAAFLGAAAVVLLWAASGPVFGFGDTWQLVINTSTGIVTFLMVFLIQNSQNRDTAALQIKLDELIARLDGPREVLLDLEDLDEETLERLRLQYALLADAARAAGDAGTRPVPAAAAPQAGEAQAGGSGATAKAAGGAPAR
ncbi:low affinity iron permease family protein [Xanthobacter sp. AM11]|uniref:low affinity iron permease family protein n=1 Tax=Xanthobacter sp. AM11 TaxID=3380643 RepID=UPI0039BF39EA